MVNMTTTSARRLSFWLLLAATALIYLWGLSASGWANPFYSAAAQAGSESWKAFFFGSFDAAGSITVDKPPLALWPMALSVRIFGLSSWSILVPQALAGVATVALVHGGVRRATGSAPAALLAGAAFALTPVAVLMFRFNNPDALLVLLLTAAALATLRAVESTRTELTARAAVWWLALAGTLVGLAFLTKMLQALLVLPAIGLTYLLFAALPLVRRLLHLTLCGLALVAAASWWVVVVELWPAASRPYIGGSQNNSVLELMLGYNGMGRLTGNEVGAVHSGSGWGGHTLLRLLGTSSGTQVSWLLPAAVVLAIAALVQLRRRTQGDDAGDDRVRTALTLWLLWAAITWLTFSLMAGIYHSYYTVALTPAIASMLGLGAHVIWAQRHTAFGRATLAIAVVTTAALATSLLASTGTWLPWLRWVVVPIALVACWRLGRSRRRGLPLGWGFAVAALLTAFVGPAAYSMATVATPHEGAIPTAGPDRVANGEREPLVLLDPTVGTLLLSSTPTPRLVELLSRDADDFTWVAAVTGANSAAGFQLATRRPVMPVGGFNGTDPSPTLARFQALVGAGRIHWYVAGGGRSTSEATGAETPVISSGSDAAKRIEGWATRHFPARRVDGVLLFDLSRGQRR